MAQNKCPLCGDRLLHGECIGCGYRLPDEDRLSVPYNLDPEDDRPNAFEASSEKYSMPKVNTAVTYAEPERNIPEIKPAPTENLPQKQSSWQNPYGNRSPKVQQGNNNQKWQNPYSGKSAENKENASKVLFGFIILLAFVGFFTPVARFVAVVSIWAGRKVLTKNQGRILGVILVIEMYILKYILN